MAYINSRSYIERYNGLLETLSVGNTAVGVVKTRGKAVFFHERYVGGREETRCALSEISEFVPTYCLR